MKSGTAALFSAGLSEIPQIGATEPSVFQTFGPKFARAKLEPELRRVLVDSGRPSVGVGLALGCTAD